MSRQPTFAQQQEYRRNAAGQAATGVAMLGGASLADHGLNQRLARKGERGVSLAVVNSVRGKGRGFKAKVHVPHAAGKMAVRGVQVSSLPLIAIGARGVVSPRKNKRVSLKEDVLAPSVRNATLAPQAEKAAEQLGLAEPEVRKDLLVSEKRRLQRHRTVGRDLSLASGTMGLTALGLRAPQGAASLVRRGARSPRLVRLANQAEAATKHSNTLGIAAIGTGSVGSFNYAAQQKLERKAAVTKAADPTRTVRRLRLLKDRVAFKKLPHYKSALPMDGVEKGAYSSRMIAEAAALTRARMAARAAASRPGANGVLRKKPLKTDPYPGGAYALGARVKRMDFEKAVTPSYFKAPGPLEQQSAEAQRRRTSAAEQGWRATAAGLSAGSVAAGGARVLGGKRRSDVIRVGQGVAARAGVPRENVKAAGARAHRAGEWASRRKGRLAAASGALAAGSVGAEVVRTWRRDEARGMSEQIGSAQAGHLYRGVGKAMVPVGLAAEVAPRVSRTWARMSPGTRAAAVGGAGLGLAGGGLYRVEQGAKRYRREKAELKARGGVAKGVDLSDPKYPHPTKNGRKRDAAAAAAAGAGGALLAPVKMPLPTTGHTPERITEQMAGASRGQVSTKDVRRVARGSGHRLHDSTHVARLALSLNEGWREDNPIELTRFKSGEMMVTGGHHRLEAAERLGMGKVPVVVHEGASKRPWSLVPMYKAPRYTRMVVQHRVGNKAQPISAIRAEAGKEIPKNAERFNRFKSWTDEVFQSAKQGALKVGRRAALPAKVVGGAGAVGGGLYGVKRWDESKHPRQGGQFAHKPGVLSKGFLKDYRERISPDAERGYKTLRHGRNEHALQGTAQAGMTGLSLWGARHEMVHPPRNKPAVAGYAAGALLSGLGSSQAFRQAGSYRGKMDKIEAKARSRRAQGLYGPGRGLHPVDSSSKRVRKDALVMPDASVVGSRRVLTGSARAANLASTALGGST